MRIKHAIVNIGIALCGLVVVLAALEGWFRLFYPQSQYAVTYCPWGFMHKPNASIIFYGESQRYGEKTHPVPIRYNSKGLRDFEYEYKKPKGVFRILLLGDSWAEDMGSFFENLHIKRLERKLNSFGLPLRFEAINGGHYAYDNAQELMFYLNEGKKYEPDLVLLMFAGDKCDYEYADIKNGELRLKYKNFNMPQRLYREAVTFIRSRSHLGNFVLNRLLEMNRIDAILRSHGLKEKSALVANFPSDHPNVTGVTDESVRKKIVSVKCDFGEIDKLIWKKFKEETERDGARFVFINNWAELATERNLQFLQENSIQVLTIQNVHSETVRYREDDIAKGRYDKFLDSSRFGYKGNEAVADKILEFLVFRRLIPYADEIERGLALQEQRVYGIGAGRRYDVRDLRKD